MALFDPYLDVEPYDVRVGLDTQRSSVKLIPPQYFRDSSWTLDQPLAMTALIAPSDRHARRDDQDVTLFDLEVHAALFGPPTLVDHLAGNRENETAHFAHNALNVEEALAVSALLCL
jgi:hypothetical protein